MADVNLLTVPGILIEGVDKTLMTRATGSFRLEYQLGARGRADLEVRDYDSFQTAYRPRIDHRVVVNPALFDGAVFNVNDVPLGDPGVGTVTRMQAMDNWRFAARRRVKETFPAGTYTLFNFVVYVVDKYLGAYGIAVDPDWPYGQGPVLGELVFDYSTVEDVFNRLAVLTSWVYRLTPTNLVQFFPVGGKLRGITFSAANHNIIGPVEWTQTLGIQANRIILRYGTGLVDRTDLFQGVDGVTRAFPITAPMAEAGWIKYPGVLDQEPRTQSWPGEGVAAPDGREYYQTDYPALQEYQNTWPDAVSLTPPGVGVPADWGPHPFFPVPSGWIWDPTNHCMVHDQAYPYNQNNPGAGTITPASVTVAIAPYLALNQEGVGPGWKWHFDPAIGPYGAIVSDYPDPPRAGVQFSFGYKVQYPLVVVVEDAADIALHGISEDLREEPSIFEEQAAIDFANGLLRKQTPTPRAVTITTRVAHDFLPGDTVQLDVPSRTLPASQWLVTEVAINADDDQNLTTRLSLLEGTEAQGSWIDFWRDMLGTGSGSAQGIASGSVIPGTGGGATQGAITLFLPATAGRLTKWASPTMITDSIVAESPDLITVYGGCESAAAAPAFWWYDSDAPPDYKVWTLIALNGLLELQSRTDAGGIRSLVQLTPFGVATFTGIPVAPTAPQGTNNTQLATTAFVRTAIGLTPPALHGPTHHPGGTDPITVLPLHAPTHNTGGTDPITALSAAVLTSGTLPDAVLPATVARRDQVNTFALHQYFTQDAIPVSSDVSNLGAFDRLWRQAHISKLTALVFTKATATLMGGYTIVGKQAGAFVGAVPAAATVIDFGQTMTVNDWVLVRAYDTTGTISSEYLKVGAVTTGTTYAVTRDLNATGAKSWAAGTPYLTLGTTGDGRIELLAYDGQPRLTFVRQGATYNAQTVGGVLGNLNTYFGYTVPTWGAAFGDPAQAWLTIESTNGLRMGAGVTTNLQIDPFGNATFSGTIIANSGVIGGWSINQTYMAKDTGTNATSTGLAPLDFPFYAGATYANRATAPFRVTNAGAVNLSNVAISTGGVVIDSTGLYIAPVPTYSNANSIHWSTDLTFRTSIWRWDDTTINGKMWNFEHRVDARGTGLTEGKIRLYNALNNPTWTTETLLMQWNRPGTYGKSETLLLSKAAPNVNAWMWLYAGEDTNAMNAQFGIGATIPGTVAPGATPGGLSAGFYCAFTNNVYTSGNLIVGYGVTNPGKLFYLNGNVPLGEWIPVPFNAANFSGYSGGTLTVAAGGVVVNKYTVIGKTILWNLVFNGTVGGTPQPYLTVIIPNAFTGKDANDGTLYAAVIESGGSCPQVVAHVWYAGANAILLTRQGGTFVPGAISIYFSIQFEIN